MAYIELNNLKKIYNKNVEAVKKFNLEIERGEFIVFLGPSGCGKSTTMRMIAGLESVTEGDIFLDGRSIVALEPRHRGISMIFQSYAVWPHMTVYENVAYALKIKKMRKGEIDKIVQEMALICDIKKYLDRYPSQLSGGQRQRVAVARAIAVQPKLFLMDEPLSNLDAKLRVAMRSELKRIHQNLHSTSIFVTHDQSEALSLADRIVVMNHGVIEQIDTPNAIYHTPETIFVAQFIGSPPANFFKAQVSANGEKIVLEARLLTLKVPQGLKNVLSENYCGKEIVVAVRPENFIIGKDGQLDAEVLIVEPQGSHVVLTVRAEKKEIKVVSDRLDFEVGESIKLGFNEKMLVYDKRTELRIK